MKNYAKENQKHTLENHIFQNGNEEIHISSRSRRLSDGRVIKFSHRTESKIIDSMTEKKYNTPAKKCLWDGIDLGSSGTDYEIRFLGRTWSNNPFSSSGTEWWK